MKKRIPSFLAGFLSAILCLSLGLTALAASGAVDFNAVGVSFNGVQISRAGESYTLPSGAQVPGVISYTDQQGGGTTYLPARRIAELMGVEIGWDAPSGCVTIGGRPAAGQPVVTPAPVATPSPAPTPAPTPVPTTAPRVEATVYITKTGEKYHRDGCRYLSRSQIAIALSDAKSQGYGPCSVCDP